MLRKSSGSGGAALESNGFERRQSAKKPTGKPNRFAAFAHPPDASVPLVALLPVASATAIDFVEWKRELRISRAES